MATKISPVWNVNDSLNVKTVMPIIVHTMAKLTARDGRRLSMKLVSIGTNTTVKLSRKPAFAAEVVFNPKSESAKTANKRMP